MTRSQIERTPESAAPAGAGGPVGLQHRLIAITGPQGSGKSTLAARLVEMEGPGNGRLPKVGRNKGADRSAQPKSSGTAVAFEGLFGTRILAGSQGLLVADCPGHPEQIDEALAWASVADFTLVVVDPHHENLMRAAPILDHLAVHKRPHALVFNQILDGAFNTDVMVARATKLCRERVLIQQLPFHRNGQIAGLIQLWDESASLYVGPDQGERPVAIPPDAALEEAVARQEFLESLSEFDDRLLVDLLDERLPSVRLLAQDLRETVGHDDVVPIYLTDAREQLGLSHLLQAVGNLAAPQWPALLDRIGEDQDGLPLAAVVQPGDIAKRGPGAICRLLRGDLSVSSSLGDVRLGSVLTPTSSGLWEERAAAEVAPGALILAPRLEGVDRGQVLGAREPRASLAFMTNAAPVYPQVLIPDAKAQTSDRPLPEKLIQSLDRLARECPSVARSFGDAQSHELLVWTTGPQQLEILRQQLATRFGFAVTFRDPAVPLRERMTQPLAKVQGRFKHQNGGHGAFGDVIIDFEPLDAGSGSGFVFEDAITGGVIPHNYIPSIEEGLREALQKGPQGHPVIDLKARLIDGSTHSVDSSDMAFRQAARLAFQHYVDEVRSTLLEPLVIVRAHVPEIFSNQLMQLIPALGGHVQEFTSHDACNGTNVRPAWNLVAFCLPQAALPELVRTARSQSQGLVDLVVESPPEAERYRVKS